MIKLFYQPIGSSMIVGISGDDEKTITQYYWSFWNWGAVGPRKANGYGDGDTNNLKFLPVGIDAKHTGYFISSAPKMKRAMINIESMRLARENDASPNPQKGKKYAEEFKRQMLEAANKRYDSMVKTVIVKYGGSTKISENSESADYE
jgi:hypothetical protein